MISPFETDPNKKAKPEVTFDTLLESTDGLPLAEAAKQWMFLEAGSTNERSRTCVFGSTLSDIQKGFREWCRQARVTPEKLWYADLFLFAGYTHIATASIDERGKVSFTKADKPTARAGKRRHKSKLLKVIFGQ